MKYQYIATAIATLAFTCPGIAQTDKDTVRWDDRAYQWVYTLYNPSDLTRYEVVRYTPRTLIEPLVKSSVRSDNNGYEYRYRISNGATARQPISNISVRAPKWDAQGIQKKEVPDNAKWPQISAMARARVAAEKAFVAKTLYSPGRWEAFLNVSQPTRVIFGWLADIQPNYTGIQPRSKQTGYSVLRNELPGAAWMTLKGDTPNIYNAAILPGAGAVGDQVAQMLSEDGVWVPVMVPAIVVPTPYNAAELARRIKAHVLGWPDSGLMAATQTSIFTPRLDALITALSSNDKKAAKAAISALTKEIARLHSDVKDSEIEDDRDTNDSKADKHKAISSKGTLEETSEPVASLDRVAARALTFDLKYLLNRLEQDR